MSNYDAIICKQRSIIPMNFSFLQPWAFDAAGKQEKKCFLQLLLNLFVI